MPQGKVIDIRDREVIVLLKKHFDQERREGIVVSTKDPSERVAKILGISKRIVQEVFREYSKKGDVLAPDVEYKGRPPHKIKPCLETVIRHRIRELNRQGSHVSLRTLSNWIGENYEKINHATLGRSLQRMGFVYGKSLTKHIFKERDDVIIARRVYLREKIANRTRDGKTLRPEVYLDESYINVNHSSSNTWYFEEEGPWVQKPSGKGKRLILVHAMTESGWVEGAKLVFEAKKQTGDYHGQMNSKNFLKWFTEMLLPFIPRESLIIMDNAPYHNIYVEGSFYPTSSTKKSELQSWLQKNHPEVYQEKMLRAELMAICKKLCPKPKYELDRIAESKGHKILRTPQYHPELQPIEKCWAVVKNYCASKCDYTIIGLREHLEDGFKKVTPKTCRAIVDIIRREEDRYWVEDMEDDELLEQKIAGF